MINIEETVDQRNSMREYLHYDFSSQTATTTLAQIEEARKRREALQALHSLKGELHVWK
jgi:hypothetical protein